MAVLIDPRVAIAFTANPRDVDDSDTFSRPDGAVGVTEERRQTWGVTLAGEGVDYDDIPAVIATQKLKITGSLPVVVTACANGTIQGKIAVNDSTKPGLVFRATGGDSFLYFGYSDGTHYKLMKRDAGVDSTVASSTTTPANNDVLKVVLLGTTVQCYVNNVLKITATVDFNITKSLAGFVVLSNVGTPTARFDDFSVALTWVDVTDKTDVRSDGLVITRGRRKETSTFSTGKATLTLFNGDRRFDNTNTASPYYGYLLPRRRVRAWVNMEVGYINISSGNTVSASNAGGEFNIGDSIDVRVNVALVDWSVNQTIIDHISGSAGWKLYIDSGLLKFAVRDGGGALKVFACTDPLAATFTANKRAWVRVLYQTNDGMSESMAAFYVTTDTAFDDANVDYGRIKGDMVFATPATNTNLSSAATIGCVGKLFWVAVYKDGALTSKLSIIDGVHSTVGPTWTRTGATIASTVIQRDRFNGFVDRWPQTVGAGTNAVVKVECFDYLGVLAQTEAPTSPWSGLAKVSEPEAWWRLGDPPMSTTVGDASGHDRHGAVTRPEQVPPPVVFGADSLNRWDDTDKSMNVNGTGWAQADYVPNDMSNGITVAFMFSTGVANDGKSHPMLSAQATNGQIGFTATVLDYAGGMVSATFFEGGNFHLSFIESVSDPTLKFLTMNSGLFEQDQQRMSIGRTYQDLTPHLVILGYHPPTDDDGTGRGAFMRIDGELVAAENVYHSMVLNWSLDVTDYANWPTTMNGDRFFIGAPVYRANPQWAPYSGFIDEVLIWQRVLEDDEILGFEEAFKRPWYGDNTGERINRILDITGTPTWMRKLDAGSTMLGEQDAFGVDQQVLTILNDTVETDRGGMYVTTDGMLRFRERHGLFHDPFVNPHYVFSDRDIPGETVILYANAVPTLGDDQIVNIARVNRKDGAVITRTDEVSRDLFMDQSATDEVGNALDVDAPIIADWIVKTKGYPKPGFDRVVLNPLYDELAALAVLDLDLEHAVQMHMHPPGWDGDEDTANVNTCSIQGYEEVFAIGIWKISYFLADVDERNYLICDKTPGDPEAIVGF